jgi:hypothetical protein
MAEFLIAAVPLLLLVVSLLFGVYPGCEAAMRLAERISSRARTKVTAVANWRRPPWPARRVAHGGLLLAFALSCRAPPA